MTLLDRLASAEDAIVATLKHPAVARLIALAVIVATVVQEATAAEGRVNWLRVAIGLGAAAAAYGSIHREPQAGE